MVCLKVGAWFLRLIGGLVRRRLGPWSRGASLQFHRWIGIGAYGLALLVILPARAEFLYTTNFETFTPGPDQWVGTDGWIGNSTGVAAHGIDVDFLPALGKTAFLGANQPSTTFVTVAQPFDHDPLAQGSVGIQIESLLGIEDSTNNRRDNFYLSFYNTGGTFLAALLFSNQVDTYGIWRLDGTNQVDTTIDFISGELHLVTIHINHALNRWSADLDGIPLFANAPFTATRQPRTLGPIAYEWLLSGSSPAEFGDNWMLVADLSVLAIPPGESPFVIDATGLDPSGQASLTFTGEPGWDYHVEYSDTGTTWIGSLPGAIIRGIESPTQVQFIDPSIAPPAGRYYRIRRTVTP